MSESTEKVPFEALKIGKVSAIDKKRCRARVVFEDRDDWVSDWLQVMQKNTMRSKFYWLPDIGELVIVAYLANGQETGIIMGSIYSEEDKPVPEIFDEEKDRDGIWFEDGTFVKYEHETQTLHVNSTRNINIHADGIVTITDSRTGGG